MQTTKFNRPYSNVTYNEKEEKYYMEIALPGIGKEDVTIETEDNLLVITTNELEAEHTPFINHFGKTWKYRLPQRTDVENINASVVNGILNIEIPLKVVRRSIKVA